MLEAKSKKRISKNDKKWNGIRIGHRSCAIYSIIPYQHERISVNSFQARLFSNRYSTCNFVKFINYHGVIIITDINIHMAIISILSNKI